MSYPEKRLYKAECALMSYLETFLQDLDPDDHKTTVENIHDYLSKIKQASNTYYYEENIKPYLLEQFIKMLDD